MQKKQSVLTCVLFLTVLFGGALLFWILPDRTFSEEENRSLRTVPVWSRERFLSGKYAEEINEYYADQFPMRDFLVGWKGITELALGKGGNNGVVLGDDGQLAKRLFDIRMAAGTVLSDMDAIDLFQIRKAAEGINRAADAVQVPMVTLLPGRTVDVVSGALSYPSLYGDAMLETLRASLGEKCGYLDTVPAYRERHAVGESVYYRTDHHWTTRGAYLSYAEVMRALGRGTELLPEDAFTKKTVSDHFYGTTWSAGGMKFVEPDKIEVWYRGNEDSFEVIADGRELDGFYSTKYLEKKDQYSFFLDGTHDVVTIRKKDGESRQRLLILKDSFANSMVPFLAQHFDLVLLNLSSARSDYTDLGALTKEYDADAVLMVYTLGNVISTDVMNRLH